ncbi:MAG: hypothetical protein DKINENOH_04289 [bacterium]|nr:hypothetical protein [bacterium]MCK6558160.1 hypothetical protein [bacterium]NUM67472.1 hypothetical protein [candidate division KSB1 bacterium]
MRKIQKKKVAKQLILGQSLLSEAKLGTNVEITIQKGAIIILPVAKKKGWQALAKLGEDAIEGVLDEPAQNHDSYIYGKDR